MLANSSRSNLITTLRRARLEYYEQNCAVDSVTKKCAGPTAECRKAMLGILGTELRSNCACKGTELTQLYDCLGWQRLLWVNPCVGEYLKKIQPLTFYQLVVDKILRVLREKFVRKARTFSYFRFYSVSKLDEFIYDR